MTNRNEERTAIALFIESVRLTHSIKLEILKDNTAGDFPDFILWNPITSNEIWVEIVQAIESGKLLSDDRRAQHRYDVAAREYRVRGEEVVLTVSPERVENVTPTPGFGVTGILKYGLARKISPPEWIAKALLQKGSPNRYGSIERAKTTLLIDCSLAVLIERENAIGICSGLKGNTSGFKEVWCVSTNWAIPKAFVLAFKESKVKLGNTP